MQEVVMNLLSYEDAKRIKTDSSSDLTDKKKLRCCEECGYLKEFTDTSAGGSDCPNGCNAGVKKKWSGMIALINPQKSFAGRLLKELNERDSGSDLGVPMRVPGLYAEEY